MDSQWSAYSDSAGNRATQFGNGQRGHPSQIPQKYAVPGPGGQIQQPQAPLGYTYETYQSPTTAHAPTIPSNVKSVSMTSSPSETPLTRDLIDPDTPMEDADPYNRSKYSTRSSQQNRASSQFLSSEESSVARKYSPMNAMSPVAPYHSSPNTSQNAYAFGASIPSSRPSPTRANTFSAASQVYQSPPCKLLAFRLTRRIFTNPVSSTAGAPSRPQAPRLPPLQSDMSPENHYPQSATLQLHTAFAQKPKTHSMQPMQPNQTDSSAETPTRKGPIPRFQKINSAQDLRPRINAQPAFRRANPEGGFISVSSCDVTHHLHAINRLVATASFDDPSAGDLSNL